MRTRFLLSLITTLSLTACSGALLDEQGFELSEFAIEGPADLAGGQGSLSVRNSGVFPHTLVISADDGTVLAASDLIQPGETAQLELVLDEGMYQFTCRIVSEKSDGEIVDHYEEGMAHTVSVHS